MWEVLYCSAGAVLTITALLTEMLGETRIKPIILFNYWFARNFYTLYFVSVDKSFVKWITNV